MKRQNAFTLIELMIVVAIMGVLGSMALPTYQSQVIKAQISEAIEIANSLKKNINGYYQKSHTFPMNNAQAGLPKSTYLMGNYFTEIEIAEGAIHVHLGNRINAHVKGKVLTFRPAVVENSPTSPIAWLCGDAQAVPGMKAMGANKTTIPAVYLEMECRKWG
jgi:type IV pilus assembly protein PilA